jgi:hypothetical protein
VLTPLQLLHGAPRRDQGAVLIAVRRRTLVEGGQYSTQFMTEGQLCVLPAVQLLLASSEALDPAQEAGVLRGRARHPQHLLQTPDVAQHLQQGVVDGSRQDRGR